MFFYNKEKNGEFYKGKFLLKFDNHDIIFYKKTIVTEKMFKESIGINLCSDSPKVFVRLRPEFFHCMFDTLGIILQEFNNNPDTVFIINEEGSYSPNQKKFSMFIFDFLNKNNIKYKNIKVTDQNTYYLNDFLFFPMYPLLYKNILLIRNALNKTSIEKDKTKKVYLSRRKHDATKSNDSLFNGEDQNNFTYKNDERIDDVEKIEKYFISLGFEIIFPEDFSSMDEQIQFFNNVTTIASVTSAGLANLIFMPENSKVIELSVPMLVGGVESMHGHYQGMSFALKHKYLAIPNSRSSDEVVHTIESDIKLKDWIMQ